MKNNKSTTRQEYLSKNRLRIKSKAEAEALRHLKKGVVIEGIKKATMTLSICVLIIFATWVMK